MFMVKRLTFDAFGPLQRLVEEARLHALDGVLLSIPIVVEPVTEGAGVCDLVVEIDGIPAVAIYHIRLCWRIKAVGPDASVQL